MLAILASVLSITFSMAAADLLAAESLAAQYSLTTSTSLPFPSATLASTDAQSLITSQWSLSKGSIQNGANDLAFVADPFPKSPTPGLSTDPTTTGPVLEVTYPAGSFSHNTGGAQFYSLWNTSDGSSFNSMMVTYEIAFDTSFDWVKGGKLPGLRGGTDPNGCDGGAQSNGSVCFSSRLMFRAQGVGETYAYIPSPNGLCNEKNIICNTDFGISIQRGAFSFVSGAWNRVTMLVQMNDPPNVANGNLMVYFNDAEAIVQQNLQFRGSSNVTPRGLFFSTFFGGNDNSFATPQETHTYYRNIQLWGGSGASTLQGSVVSAAVRRPLAGVGLAAGFAAVTFFGALVCL